MPDLSIQDTVLVEFFTQDENQVYQQFFQTNVSSVFGDTKRG